jgi:hypothetical protein
VAFHHARIPALSDCLDIGRGLLLAARPGPLATTVAAGHRNTQIAPSMDRRRRGDCGRDGGLCVVALVCRTRDNCSGNRRQRRNRRSRRDVLWRRVVATLHRWTDLSRLPRGSSGGASPFARAAAVSGRAATRSGCAGSSTSRSRDAESTTAGNAAADIQPRSRGFISIAAPSRQSSRWHERTDDRSGHIGRRRIGRYPFRVARPDRFVGSQAVVCPGACTAAGPGDGIVAIAGPTRPY